MRKVRFTEEQMVAIMREADREPVAVVAKRHGISEQTIYVWRKRFGGFAVERRAAAETTRGKELSAQYPRYGSPHPYLSRPRRASHERRLGLPALARGRLAAAAQEATQARGSSTATPASAVGTEPGVVV